MRNFSIPFVIVVALTSAALLSTACDSDNEDRRGPLQPTGISSFASSPDLAVTVRPTSLVRRPVVGAQCPFRHPFSVPLEVLIESTSESSVFLNRVEFRFVDSSGVAGPQVATGQPALERQFGHVGLPTQSSRVFPFSFEFGCGTLPHGRIHVDIETIDPGHRSEKRSFTVPVH